MIYQWRDGARVSIDPQEAGARLEFLRDKHGGLSASILVADARRKASPLHDHFNWDDAAAAHEHRLERARLLLRSLVVIGEPIAPEAHRAYVALPGGGEAYESITVAMSDPDTRAQILVRARRELAAWRERYAELKELAEIHAAIDQRLGA